MVKISQSVEINLALTEFGFITSIDISTYTNVNGDIIWKQNIRTFLT